MQLGILQNFSSAKVISRESRNVFEAEPQLLRKQAAGRFAVNVFSLDSKHCCLIKTWSCSDIMVSRWYTRTHTHACTHTDFNFTPISSRCVVGVWTTSNVKV